MKALVTTHDSLFPVYGGGALRTLLAARELKERGWEVVLLGPSQADTIDGMRVYAFPAPTKRRSQILSSIKFNVRLLVRGLRTVRGADLIFVHNTIAAPTAGLLAKVFGKRLVLDITDLHAEYLRIGHTSWIENRLRPLLIWLEYRLVDMADEVIVVTEEMKRRVVERGISPGKVRVVYDGVALERFSSEKTPDSRYRVAHIGLIDKQHGVDILVRAIPHVVERQPQARFLFVGDGREAAAVKALSRQLGVSAYCEFPGFQPHERVTEYLKTCAVGVIPRPDTLANHMVVTLKLLEYWASGTAVVASRLRGIEEIATDGESIVFFEPGNPEALAEKLLKLWEDPARLEGLRQEGLAAAQRLKWSNLIPAIVDAAVGKAPVPASPITP